MMLMMMTTLTTRSVMLLSPSGNLRASCRITSATFLVRWAATSQSCIDSCTSSYIIYKSAEPKGEALSSALLGRDVESAGNIREQHESMISYTTTRPVNHILIKYYEDSAIAFTWLPTLWL
jgi:hypothetical protein